MNRRAGTDGGAVSVGALLPRCSFPPRGAVLHCAVSGGADSSALAVLAVAAGCEVTLWHVDHQLRAGSAQEGEVVERLAARLGVNVRRVTAEVGVGPNLEARARRARYAALPAGVATGHTADDQVETMIVNLLRGTGVDGLAGMRPGSAHPILGLRRAETQSLCVAEEIDTVQDPTNVDPRFVRNRVRAEVLPLLAEVAGRDIVPILCRQAGHLRAVSELLATLAEAIDPTDVRALRAAPAPVAAVAVRSWLAKADDEGHPPDAAATAAVLAVVSHRSRKAQVGGGLTVRRHRGHLLLEQESPPAD